MQGELVKELGQNNRIGWFKDKQEKYLVWIAIGKNSGFELQIWARQDLQNIESKYRTFEKCRTCELGPNDRKSER